jgi:Fe-S-cluster containining protein
MKNHPKVEYKLQADPLAMGLIDSLAKLLFRCWECGACCNGDLFEAVPLSDLDEERLLTGLDWGREQLREGCKLIEGKQNEKKVATWALKQPCCFLRKEGGCSAYSCRPESCRNYPIFVDKDAMRIFLSCEAAREFVELVKRKMEELKRES